MELHLDIPAARFRELRDLHARRGQGLSFPGFLLELLEMRLVEYRSRPPEPREMIRPLDEAEKKLATPEGRGSRRRLTPEQTQVALHLHFSELMTKADIARRLRCSPSTLARIFAAYEDREHAPLANCRGHRASATRKADLHRFFV